MKWELVISEEEKDKYESIRFEVEDLEDAFAIIRCSEKYSSKHKMHFIINEIPK